MQLDPRQLAAFDAAIATTSLSAAARQLRITLAATSLRIKALEATLGQRLLVRGKVARATIAGQALLTHIKRVRLLEADLGAAMGLGAGNESHAFQSLSIAVNADSLGSWFLSGIQDALLDQRLTLNVTVDDQEHTLELLKNGDVIGCVTTAPNPLRGCLAEALGTMRYRCVATQKLREALSSDHSEPSLHQLLSQPAIGFNTKDSLQDQFLKQCFGVSDLSYPRHHIPASDAYRAALCAGLGWGMQADVQAPNDLPSGELIDLYPGRFVDVPLFWHHWQHEPSQAARLTRVVVAAAKQRLIQK